MKKTIRLVVVVLISACLIVGYYFYLSTRTKNGAENQNAKESEVQQVISFDLNNKYPSTPRGVIKLYNRILKCYYNEEMSEEEFLKLVDKQFELLDEELQNNNPKTQMVQNVRGDRNRYKEQKRTIRSTSLCGSNEVVYKTVDGKDCAYVTCSYFMKVGSEHESTLQRYVLRRSNDGKWKILVYYIVKGEK